MKEGNMVPHTAFLIKKNCITMVIENKSYKDDYHVTNFYLENGCHLSTN